VHAERFEPLPPEKVARWDNFGRWPGRTYFPSMIGIILEEVRTDYARLRLPYRPELDQPAGVVHGGALAALVDTCVVPAIGQAYAPEVAYSTVSMQLNYLRPAVQTDVIAEGWVTRRGKQMVFCQAEAHAGGKTIIEAMLTYAVKQ
jgi:uncharacterized protein (TIGR00369 family)